MPAFCSVPLPSYYSNNFAGKINASLGIISLPYAWLLFSSFVTGFWKTYHLHTSEIIIISDFVLVWLVVISQPNVFQQLFW